ncbi:MAG TPA: hypothetical protein VEB20_15735 [Azospirillaceae bacterium]|nr:hypothetical protein [Azospirillaceae bacterium]
MSTPVSRRPACIGVRHLPRLTRRRLAVAARHVRAEGWAFVSIHALRPPDLAEAPRVAPEPYALSEHPPTLTEQAAFAAFRRAVALVLLELVQHGTQARAYPPALRARAGARLHAEPDGTVRVTRGLKIPGGAS